MTLPLEGIRVIDFSNLVPGPYCTMILADLGAEVIKIERPPHGDLMRSMSSRMFEAMNRNKKSVVANLKNESDLEMVKAYIKESDVLLESFRPNVMKRLGLGYDEVAEINDKIIYCSMSGYGQTGPLSNASGHDINYLAVSGVLSLSGDPLGPPAPWGGIQIADFSAAMYATVAILSSLRRRDQDKQGDYIDISITDSTLSWVALRMADYFEKNHPPKHEFMGRGAYGVFLTKDEKYIAIGCLEDFFYHHLCDAIQLPELKEKEQYATWELRNKHHQELNGNIAPKIAEKTLDEWLTIFADYDVPCSQVNEMEDLVHEQQFQERDLFHPYGENPEEDVFVKFPVLFKNTKLNELNRAPKLGEHNLTE